MADYLKYDNQNFIIASGNVQLFHSDITLNADMVILETSKSKFVAQGHVSVNYLGKNIHAERLEYNIYDKDLVFDEFISTFNMDESSSPVYFKCKSIEKKYGVYFGGESSFSTCKPGKQHYVITAKKFVLYPGERIEAYDVFAYAGILPFLYTPYYEFQLGYRNPIYLMPIVGQNNVEGMFIKNTFDYYYNRDFHAMFLFDVMEKKNYGIGIQGEYFRKKKYPGEIYIYSIDPANYAFSATQRFIFNARQNVSVSVKKRNLYRVYGGRDDYEEYKASITDPAVGILSVLNKTDYSYKWDEQQVIWNKNIDGTQLDFNITLDDYKQSATKYDKIILNANHAMYQNNFSYFNTNYYNQNKRYERLYNNFHSNIGDDFSLDLGMTYQNNNSNGLEDLQLNPKIGLLYYAYKNEWFKNKGIKLIRLDTNFYIDPDGDRVTSDDTIEYRESIPELTIDFDSFSLSNINYTPQVVLGLYRERKNIGIMRDITYKRVLLRNALSTKLIQNNLVDLGVFANYDQYLYDTGDKQYMFSDRAELTLLKDESVSSKLTYSESTVQGYTPFYFDEIRSSQKRATNVLTYKVAQYLTLRVEDAYNFLTSYREIQRMNASYMVNQNQYIILSTAYDYNTNMWSNLQSQVVFLKDKENYITMKTNVSLQTGEIADSRIQVGYSVGREERWIFKTELLWSNYNKIYTIPTVEIIRDLGCVSLKYSYNDYLKEHMVIFKITAFPEDAMGYSYGLEGFKLEGVGDSSVER
ncbi:MAG: hypothetical protein A2Y40_00425 [Candidatus Margulisbacteria bacterium GWF2_35_9]|nr:MAG: hypothetical protein A2Y40_00425 [Candidatus Margulisbacteria bacterium GWF2_35_9]